MTVPSLDAFGIFNAAEEWSERVKRVKSKSTEGGFKKGKLVCRTEAEDEVLVGGGEYKQGKNMWRKRDGRWWQEQQRRRQFFSRRALDKLRAAAAGSVVPALPTQSYHHHQHSVPDVPDV